ncbi:MAG: hypothetical protein ABWK05_07050 [Pyrobaculum sp.]
MCLPAELGVVKDVGELAGYLLSSYVNFGAMVAWRRELAECLYRIRLFVLTSQIDQFMAYLNIPLALVGNYVVTNPAFLELLSLVKALGKK